MHMTLYTCIISQATRNTLSLFSLRQHIYEKEKSEKNFAQRIVLPLFKFVWEIRINYPMNSLK